MIRMLVKNQGIVLYCTQMRNLCLATLAAATSYYIGPTHGLSISFCSVSVYPLWATAGPLCMYGLSFLPRLRMGVPARPIRQWANRDSLLWLVDACIWWANLSSASNDLSLTRIYGSIFVCSRSPWLARMDMAGSSALFNRLAITTISIFCPVAVVLNTFTKRLLRSGQLCWPVSPGVWCTDAFSCTRLVLSKWHKGQLIYISNHVLRFLDR